MPLRQGLHTVSFTTPSVCVYNNYNCKYVVTVPGRCVTTLDDNLLYNLLLRLSKKLVVHHRQMIHIELPGSSLVISLCYLTFFFSHNAKKLAVLYLNCVYININSVHSSVQHYDIRYVTQAIFVKRSQCRLLQQTTDFFIDVIHLTTDWSFSSTKFLGVFCWGRNYLVVLNYSAQTQQSTGFPVWYWRSRKMSRWRRYFSTI